MNCCEVEISIDIQEGKLPLKSLLDLIHVDLTDRQVVLHCEIHRLPCGDFVELDHFWIG